MARLCGSLWAFPALDAEVDDADLEDDDPTRRAAAAGNDPMRLIRLYAARACFRASTWLAMLGKWLAGV